MQRLAECALHYLATASITLWLIVTGSTFALTTNSSWGASNSCINIDESVLSTKLSVKEEEEEEEEKEDGHLPAMGETPYVGTVTVQ